MNPASVLSIADDAGILENAQMEREPRLRGVEGIGELADAPFPAAEKLDDLESGLVGEGVEELDRTLGAGSSRYGHGRNISRNVVGSRAGYQLKYRQL